MLRRLRGSVAGTGSYGVLAFCCVLLGVIFLGAEVQSPDLILWTGRPVPGTSFDGTVSYIYKGQQYTVPAHPVPVDLTRTYQVTVYLDPSHPDTAMEDDAYNRWLTAVAVPAPWLAAGVLIWAGRRRRSRLARHPLPRTTAAGHSW